jgi:RNA polymerase sigma-70 factor (ECF subfamily)
MNAIQSPRAVLLPPAARLVPDPVPELRPETDPSRPVAGQRGAPDAIVAPNDVREPSDHEDIVQVEAFLAGDRKAFEFLFDKYREKVYSIAYRFVRNREDALEVTQEVFLRVYLGLAKFKTNSKFFTWLYRITVNRAIDFSRSRKARPTVRLEPAALEAWGERPGNRSRPPDPMELAQEKELEERLLRAVELLSPKHRSVFLLHACENLSYKEIAAVLGCNLGTVMSRLFYARQRLQEILAAQGGKVGG